jgi:phosphatidylglycerol lysyltransferase
VDHALHHVTPAARGRLARLLPPAAALAVFAAALHVLQRELAAVTWHSLSADVARTSPALLAWAGSLTALNYAVLTGYDFIAFASIGKRIARARVAATAFLAYAVANNVGFAVLSGASVRYRFYSRWGLTPGDLSRIVISYSVTFWLGLLSLGGLSLALRPPAAAWRSGLSAAVARTAGWSLVALCVAYVVTASVRRSPLRIRSLELSLPPASIALGQLLVSAVDWALAGAVFYVLLPPHAAPFVTVLGAFLAAQIVALASHVPGGVGVFEGLIVLFLGPSIDSAQLVPALLVYRLVYYVCPLALALAGLAVHELHRQRAWLRGVAARVGRIAERATPRALAALTFAGGLVLLCSGATPAAEGRLALLDRVLPLGVIETSHFLGSVAGAGLLLLSQGLVRRLDAAHALAVAAAGVGIAASLLKGGDYEEALLLTLLLAALVRARPAFNRTAALFATRFSPAWVMAVGGALAASVWLGLFAFRHVEYAHDLWWQFALDAEASRFLRGSVGAAALTLVFAGTRLLRPAPPEIDAPDDADLETAAGIIAQQPATYPCLVFLRDKGLLFDDDRRAFLMYAVRGRTWVALGDPVGPPERAGGLVRRFLERCDDFGGTPVFYQVGPERLHLYADFGLAFVKLGEEARVDLSRFTLDGREGAKRRQLIRRLEQDGGTFRIVAPGDVPGIADQLEAVSNDWLDAKAGAEKGFSLGSFDREYLARFPVAVVEHGGRVVAFGNLWAGGGRHELSIDLMRYHRGAPRSVMEALLVHVLAWGQAQGYEWFALGMAPMSGFESSPVAPLWARAGRFLYTHGEGIYRFQGLRAYKEKFHPVWKPHYLAYRGGLQLPRILADVAVLVAGGYRRIFRK